MKDQTYREAVKAMYAEAFEIATRRFLARLKDTERQLAEFRSSLKEDESEHPLEGKEVGLLG